MITTGYFNSTVGQWTILGITTRSGHRNYWVEVPGRPSGTIVHDIFGNCDGNFCNEVDIFYSHSVLYLTRQCVHCLDYCILSLVCQRRKIVNFVPTDTDYCTWDKLFIRIREERLLVIWLFFLQQRTFRLLHASAFLEILRPFEKKIFTWPTFKVYGFQKALHLKIQVNENQLWTLLCILFAVFQWEDLLTMMYQ